MQLLQGMIQLAQNEGHLLLPNHIVIKVRFDHNLVGIDDFAREIKSIGIEIRLSLLGGERLKSGIHVWRMHNEQGLELARLIITL